MADLVLDPWSYYDYKTAFSQDSIHPVPSWVNGDDRRRVRAYSLLDSYYKNAAREFLSGDATDAAKRTRREYGDAETIRDQIFNSLLGDTQTITVADAIGSDNDPRSAEILTALEDWAYKENFGLRLMEAEKNAVGLGDGVYVLGINERTGRPKLRTYDPAFYYPVFDEDSDSDFPEKVHIAYEFERMEDGQKRKYLRRITWELVRLEDLGEGEATVSYPWNDGPSEYTCLYSDGVWNIGEMRGTVPDLDPGKARWRQRNLDLDIDFIPVIHLPNLGGGEAHFGTACIARIMQILDDLVSTDTDLQAASATTGSPPIAVSGASLPKDSQGRVATYGPGTVWETGDGTATMIDTSRSLDALLKYDEHLLERLSVNGRIPESLLGRVKPNEVPSGIALTLSFTPHSGMIREMRQLRAPKYTLLFKFVARFLMQTGELSPGSLPDCGLEFGTFLPADKQETSTLVSQLLRKDRPIISLETAVRMLVEAGFPIEDAAEEVERIIQEDFAGANDMLDATGDPMAVRERLGLPPLQEEDFDNGLDLEEEEEII